MSPAFTTRRRAEEFDRLVERTLSGAPVTGPVSADLAELADFAAALSTAPAVAPRPAFAADLRERLMAAAVTELAPGGGTDAITERLTVRSSPVRRKHERRVTVGIASLAIIGASAGTALASQGSLPGETLYPVKRAIENVRSGFTPGDDGKGAVILADADRRLDEVAQLSRGSDDNVDRINDTLDAFAEQAKKASDLLLSDYQQNKDADSIEKLHEFTSDSIDQLTVLEPLLPDGAKPALTSAAQAVLMIDTAASTLCPTCGGGAITAVPETLLSATTHTINSLAQSLVPKTEQRDTPSAPSVPSATKTPKPSIALPSVPADVGPANVLPSVLPGVTGGTAGSGSGTSTGQGTTRPTAKPSTVGGVVQGVTGGVGDALDGVTGGLTSGLTDQLDGTVGGVAGGVDDLLGGLLGTKKSTK